MAGEPVMGVQKSPTWGPYIYRA